MEAVIYTDGGSYNNGDRKGDGSYAFLILDEKTDEYVDIYCEFVQNTTNNRMEMEAVISGLKYLNDHGYDNVKVISDSGYVVKGYTDPRYLNAWIQNAWHTSSGGATANKDLWEEFIKLRWHIGFSFVLIKGHKKDSNIEHAYWNDIVDGACTYMLNMKMPGLFTTLRYNFKDKSYTPINAQITERNANGI